MTRADADGHLAGPTGPYGCSPASACEVDGDVRPQSGDTAPNQTVTQEIKQDVKDALWGAVDALAGKQVGPGTPGEKEAASAMAVPVAGMATEGAEVEKGAEVLTRFGKEVESAEKLAKQAAAAEEKIGVHGVSTTARPSPRTPGSSALRSDVEKTFNVHNTGSDPFHRTVELMKPVTQAVADAFNRVFGRIP